MDGLMVDTEPLARRAWDEVVAPYGVAISDDLYGRMLGRRTTETAQLVLADLPLPLSADDLLRRKTDGYLAILDTTGVPTMPGLHGPARGAGCGRSALGRGHLHAKGHRRAHPRPAGTQPTRRGRGRRR